MNGNNFLLDTNVLIGMYKRNPDAFTLLSDSGARLADSGYSSITRIELLSYPGITCTEQTAITALLDRLIYYPFSRIIENETIAVRGTHRVKLPDAIIMATAQIHGLLLLTLDRKLAALANNIST